MSRDSGGRASADPVVDWLLPRWFKKSYNILVIEVFILLLVGGSVRIMNAGLACPDWPLCFGEFIPDYHPQVYLEFIHRVMAGVISISLAVLNYYLFRSRAPRSLKAVGCMSIVILIAQIIFGGLTVRMLLSPPIVATHLFLGTAFFLSLLWVYLTVKESAAGTVAASASAAESGTAGFTSPAAPRVNQAVFHSTVVFVATYIQVILGGMVAANFASLVCTDFPTCHGQWFPTFSGIIGLHMIHRYWAYCLFVLILINWLAVRRSPASAQTRRLAALMFAGVCVQVCLGIANVLLLTPPLIAVLHLAMGVTVLSLGLRQIRSGFAVRNRFG